MRCPKCRRFGVQDEGQSGQLKCTWNDCLFMFEKEENIDTCPITNQTVPEKSLCCGSAWIGGHQLPGRLMKLGLRVFYKCGASLSVHDDLGDGAYFLLSKNCCDKEEQENGKVP